MNLQDYIATGILEKYVLDLTTPSERAEVEHLRKLSPEIRAELAAVEQRIERVHLDSPVPPPVATFFQVMQRLDWQEPHGEETPPAPPRDAYILQSGKTMTISIWWRCAFVVAVVLVIALACSTIFLYNRVHDLEQFLWKR